MLKQAQNTLSVFFYKYSKKSLSSRLYYKILNLPELLLEWHCPFCLASRPNRMFFENLGNNIHELSWSWEAAELINWHCSLFCTFIVSLTTYCNPYLSHTTLAAVTSGSKLQFFFFFSPKHVWLFYSSKKKSKPSQPYLRCRVSKHMLKQKGTKNEAMSLTKTPSFNITEFPLTII